MGGSDIPIFQKILKRRRNITMDFIWVLVSLSSV